jgi:Flp pilus assembly protein TadG
MTRITSFGRIMLSKLRVLACNSGAAATEFALIVPVLAALVVSIDDVSSMMVGTASMQTASRSAIQYAMRGGTDMAAARTLGLQAWDHKPADAIMSVVQACLCSGAAAGCNAPCADNTVPQKFVTVTVSGTYGGNVYKKKTNLTENVRLR